jgi:hypothetical protein
MKALDRNSKPPNSRTVLVLDDDVLVRMPVVQLHITDTFDLGGLRGATSNK